MIELRGKVALVTGGSGGIGRAIGTALASAGVNVAISYVNSKEDAIATADTFETKSYAVPLDTRDLDSIDLAVDAIIKKFGRIDILVNNAAWNVGIPFTDLDDLTPAIWDHVLDTNLRGAYLLVRRSAKYLRVNGYGRIINIASLAGLYPLGSSIAYSVSKAGLIHLTRCLAVALAPHVTVNCIAPGLVEGTRMAQRVPTEVADAVKKQVVLGRVADVEDIAAQVLVLCRSKSVTGQVLVIDGGMPGGMR